MALRSINNPKASFKDTFVRTGLDAHRNYHIPMGTEENPAESAQELYDGGYHTDGFYWIKAGNMATAKQIWCDMTDGHASAGGVGGWNRFWWYGTYEQTGTSPSSFPTGDCFGNLLESLTHTATSGFGRIPEGLTPSWLMVKGNSADVPTNSGRLRWVVWQFNNASTPNAVKASMQSGTVRDNTSNPGSNWLPSYDGSGNSSFPYGDLDSWWYSDNWQNGRGKGFNLDDDGHYGNTAFGGGNDHGGVVCVDFCTDGENASQTNNLSLFWK